MKHLVQVAGIIDKDEANSLVGVGVDWLGFPLRLPSGNDDISESDAARIISDLPEPHAGVLITYMTKADEIKSFCDQLGVKGVQIHGDISYYELQKLREISPDLYILKSLVVKNDNTKSLFDLVDQCGSVVDMFITDTFDPKTGAKGATGLIHDWSISVELVKRSPKPLMLAGGLIPENVGQAIQQVRPAGVDAHSGLEGPNGRKDKAKVMEFVTAARKAFQSIA